MIFSKKQLKSFVCESHCIMRMSAFATRHLPRIFMYHRFTGEICDSGHVVSRENFNWQLQQIKQGPWTTMTQAEYIFRRRRGFAIPVYTVILTIDDGYQDFYEVAYPLLKEHGFSATFFVTTGFVEDENWFWFDLLRYAIDHAETTDAEIRFGNHSILLETATKVEKDQTSQRLSDICINISDHDKWSLIDEVVKKLCAEVPDNPTREYAPATWEQLKEMAENGIEIGAHSSTHPVLSQLDTERLPDEICNPHEILSSRLGRPVETICYPNGRKIDVTPEVMDLVKTVGYLGGVLGGGFDFSDLLRLPRLGVTIDRVDFLWKLYGV
jgi:peptidoglycan/xylan/chitin deacetylase (PgdA/CDA1 family)